MFCNGGDFRSYLTKKQKIPEPEAKVLVLRLFKFYFSIFLEIY